MSPSTEPLDDRLTDMGRALASSLLGDITVARPVRSRPEPAEPLSRRERRELREQREREAGQREAGQREAGERHEFPPPGGNRPTEAESPVGVEPEIEPEIEPESEPTPTPEPTASSGAALVRQGDAPVRSEPGASAPAAPDGTQFQVARPRRRPERDVPPAEPRPADSRPTRPQAGAPHNGAPAARGPQPQPQRGPQPRPRTEPQARGPQPQAEPRRSPQPRPQATLTPDGAARRPAPPAGERPAAVRDRVRPVTRDPFAALPWPDDEPPARDRGRPGPEARPGSKIRDLDLKKVARPDDDDTKVLADETSGKRMLRSATEWIMVLGTAAVVALLLQHFVVQLYEIPSESMFPTLKNDDQVLVNKLAYAVGGGVERGDVIVFKRPASERTDDPDQPPQLIKRVIGLPGDVVEARGGVVYVDGKPLEETGDDHYLDPSVVTNNLPQPVTVPRGHVFVMGDNRERSHDSRYFGPIPESDIIGRAVVIAWPFSRWGTL